MRFAELFSKHQQTIHDAGKANASRQFYAHWQESPSKKIYGETAPEDGEAAFKAALNVRFTRLNQSGETQWQGEEVSPYGFALGISYPHFTVESLINNAREAQREWQKLTPADRTAVLVETLERAAAHFFEIAHATMHTTGQGFGMSFQASGPHSFDRALEALVMGYSEQTHVPSEMTWVKPAGQTELTVQKKFRVVPKGIGLVIGCSTFPIWNTVPGLYASLVTGNPVIVKPHPKAVLPIAIVVASMRHTLKELGLSPALVQLAVDSTEQPLALALVEHPAISIIDFTGGAFGNTIEEIGQKHGKSVFTEKAGVNAVILESASNLEAVLDNIAWTLTLYSGQMCTTSQNIFINKVGVYDAATASTVSFADVTKKLAEKIDVLVNNPKMGGAVAGGIQSDATFKRVQDARNLSAQGARIVRDSAAIAQTGFDNARTASPLILEVPVNKPDLYEHEWFGPISFVIPTDGFDHSLSLLLRSLQTKGALTTLVYTTDAAQREKAEETIIFDGKAPVAFNYTGGVFVNQSAAYSDFHGAGANAAGNASFADASFVTNRFNLIGTREVIV